MSGVLRPGRSVCHVLREDVDLAEAIEVGRRQQAIEACVVPQFRLPAGSWRTDAPAPVDRGLGLLMLEGVLIHRIAVEERFGAEVLGEGDVLRPVAPDGAATPLSPIVDWLVLEPLRVAVLDEGFVRQMADFPQLAGRLFSRATLRSRQLVVNIAIIHQARVDVRLHMLLWHLAGRWGRVRSDGVVLPLRLTHTVLSDLVAARRPTVTSALSDLSRRGVVHAVQEGWLLSGDPPGELAEVRQAAAP